MAAETQQAEVGYRQLLSDNRNFRRLWLAEIISFLGDWFNTVALYSAVAELSQSTHAITAVFIAKLLPIFVMTPVAGPLIDRVDRRTLLIITDLARAGCALGLLLAYWLKSLPLLMVFLVVMVCFSGIFVPTRTAVFPQITTRGELPAANALSAGTWSVMLALGAAAGGVVTAYLGIEVSMIIDALSFLLSAAFLLPLPKLLPTSDSPQITGPSKDERGFAAGLRYLRQQPYLAALISLKPMLAGAGGILAMLPVFSSRVFVGTEGPLYMGLLYTARGVGALIGSLGIRGLVGSDRRSMRRAIVPAFAIVALSYLALSVTTGIWQAAAAYGMAAVGGGALWVFAGTLGQLESDNAFRGRVFAIEWGLLTLVMSLTAGVASQLVERYQWHVRDIAAATGVMMFFPMLLWIGALVAFKRRRQPDS